MLRQEHGASAWLHVAACEGIILGLRVICAMQAARLEVFGPQDADSFEGLGMAKALADHLEGASAVTRRYSAGIDPPQGSCSTHSHQICLHVRRRAAAAKCVRERLMQCICWRLTQSDRTAADLSQYGAAWLISILVLYAAYADINYSSPTRIQRAAIPVLLAGRDALVNAPTGSGKTLAYLAPLINDLQVRMHPMPLFAYPALPHGLRGVALAGHCLVNVRCRIHLLRP